jgi:hypothetical protein
VEKPGKGLLFKRLLSSDRSRHRKLQGAGIILRRGAAYSHPIAWLRDHVCRRMIKAVKDNDDGINESLEPRRPASFVPNGMEAGFRGVPSCVPATSGSLSTKSVLIAIDLVQNFQTLFDHCYWHHIVTK